MRRVKTSFCFVIIMLLGIVLSSQASAAQLRFVLEDEPIYTSSSKQSPGFLMEVVTEMTKILKVNPKIEFHPWGKAQELAIATPNTMIFPLARTKAREPNYLWICKVFDVKTVFISPKGSALIKTLDQAKKINKIGVIEATPYHAKLKELGFNNIASMPSNQLQAALHEKKVDAVCTPGSEFAFAWKKAGYKTRLQMGAELQTVPLWLAGSKKSNLIKVDEWIEAFDIVQQEGKFDLLYERYFGSGK
jgi:polar amino acid transport system substrate-binding protein